MQIPSEIKPDTMRGLHGAISGGLRDHPFVYGSNAMSFAAELNSSEFKLPAPEKNMHALQNEVFAELEQKVLCRIEEAKRLKHSLLVSTLPAFYDNIAQAIEAKQQRADTVSTAALAIKHGKERARLTNYVPEGLILEYQLLRAALLEITKRNGMVLNEKDLQVIDASFEEAIREAVTAYFLELTTMRELAMCTLLHNLKNPLAVVSANAELIEHTATSPETKTSAAAILSTTGRMNEMFHELLDVMVCRGGARLRLEPFNFDILQLVKHVCVQAEVAHGPRFKITGDAVEVFWSHEEIHRALENLIGNAVKYGTPNTPISIKLERVDDRLSMSVHNEGNPISLDESEAIFQVFKRSRAARRSNKEGWGIGLPFVRAVAQSHGGNCTVVSTLETGTTFFMDVPVDARPFQEV